MKKTGLILLVIIIHFSASLFAQRDLGLSTGEYNTLNSMYNNPANLAGCAEKFALNLFSFSLTFDNNLGTVPSLGNITSDLGNNSSSNSLFSPSSRNRFSMLLPILEVRGPGVLFAINDKNTFAISTRLMAFNQFNNFDRNLYNYVTNPNFQSNNSYGLNINGFNWTAQIWSELAFSYGGVIYDNDKIQVKGGATVRYLMGTGFISLKSNNFDVYYSAGSDSLYSQKSDLHYSSTAYGPSSAFLNGASGSGLLNNFLGSPIGSGVGADLGVIVVLNPKTSEGNDGAHQIKLSLSVTDIGAIAYKSSNTFGAEFQGNGYLTATGLANNINNFSNIRQYFATQGFTADTNSVAKKVSLPTALLIGGDYNIYKPFFVNVTAVANLVNRQNLGNSYYGQVSITPRFDTRIFTFGFPITYNMLTDNIRLGMGLRFSGFFMGSDDMLMFFANHQYGINFYMGGYIPIGKNKKREKDFKAHL